MKSALVLTLSIVSARGQMVSFGVKAGGVATGALDPLAQSVTEAKRYTFGGMAEVRLPFRLAAEFDALYKRTGDSQPAGCVFTYCSAVGTRANIFEFPLLLKRRLRRGPVKPYVAGGISYRRVGEATVSAWSWRSGPMVLGEAVDTTLHHGTGKAPAENNVGGVAGAGVEFKAGFLKLAPEFRYTRWNSRYWEFNGPRGFFTGSNPNQAEVLFGIVF